MDKEIWKDIEGYEGLYQVSNYGRVKSFDQFINQKNNSKALRKGRILKQSKNKDGYLRLRLVKNKKGKTFFVHRLVAKTFISNPRKLNEVNHKDGNKENNNADNLEWCNRSENISHAYKLGLEQKYYGTDSHRALFTLEEINQIRLKYIPRSRKYGARALAREYGVNRTTIERILRKETYKNE